MTILVGISDISLLTDSTGSFALSPGVPIVDTMSPQTLAAGLVTDSDGVFAAAIAAAGAPILAPVLFTDNDAIYAPAVSAGTITLQSPLVSDADVVYAPSVVVGAVVLLPPLVTDVDVVYAPSATAVVAGALVPAFVTDADTIFAASIRTVTQFLQLPLVIDADAVYPPTLVAIGTLLPGRVTDADVIYAAAAIQDRVLRPALFIDPETAYPLYDISTVKLPKSQTLRAGTLTSDDVIFPARLSLSPSRVLDSDVIYATITQWVNRLLPALVPNDDVVRAPSVAPIVQPAPVQDNDAIYTPRLTLFLLPARVVDTDVIPAADVGWKVFAQFVGSDDQIFGVAVHAFNGLQPNIIVEDDVIDTYPFFVQHVTGGIPVPDRIDLTGSIARPRRLTGNFGNRRTLTGSISGRRQLTGSMKHR